MTEENKTRIEDELSIKDILIKVKYALGYLRSQWKWIGLFVLLGAGFGLLISYIVKVKYTAECTFVLEDGNSSPLGAYAGIASQFGFDLGSSMGSSGIFEGDNILEFLKSRMLIENTLLTRKDRNSKITLADYYYEVSGLKNKFKNKPELVKLTFPPKDARNTYTIVQDSVLNILQKRLGEKELKVDKPDKKLSFIKVQCTTVDEVFAKEFTERLVTQAIDFYVKTKTQKSKSSIDKLQFQADSLEQQLNRKTYSVAKLQDINLNPAKQMAGVSSELETRDKVVLQTMYGEVVKNLELSKISMTQETPIIQMVDVPRYPLDQKKIKPLTGIIMGAFLGGFLVAGFLILLRLYREIMS